LGEALVEEGSIIPCVSPSDKRNEKEVGRGRMAPSKKEPPQNSFRRR